MLIFLLVWVEIDDAGFIGPHTRKWILKSVEQYWWRKFISWHSIKWFIIGYCWISCSFLRYLCGTCKLKFRIFPIKLCSCSLSVSIRGIGTNIFQGLKTPIEFFCIECSVVFAVFLSVTILFKDQILLLLIRMLFLAWDLFLQFYWCYILSMIYLFASAMLLIISIFDMEIQHLLKYFVFLSGWSK